MKKVMLLTICAALLFASCASSPSTGATEQDAAQKSEQQEKVNQAFEEVYDAFEKVLITDGAQNYKVKYGDTLSIIAKEFYGKDNGYYFPLIMLASSSTVLDPDLIEPGMTLTIPDLQKNLNDTTVHKSLKKYFNEIADVYKTKKTPAADRIRKELLEIAKSL